VTIDSYTPEGHPVVATGALYTQCQNFGHLTAVTPQIAIKYSQNITSRASVS